jgi:hypothetical protein
MPDMHNRLGLGLALTLVAAGCGDLVPGVSPNAGTATGSPPAQVTPSPSPSFVRPTPNPSPTFVVHVVHSGESLSSIARLYGTTARSIAFWNRDQYPSLDPDSDSYEPDRIVVGWTLQLIPTEVVAEDELPIRTPSPSPTPTPSPAAGEASAAPTPSPGPS